MQATSSNILFDWYKSNTIDLNKYSVIKKKYSRPNSQNYITCFKLIVVSYMHHTIIRGFYYIILGFALIKNLIFLNLIIICDIR